LSNGFYHRTNNKTSQELPEQWNNVKKQGVMVKQQVAPLQANEVAIIRRKCTAFDVKQHEFRE
jgi:dynein heavy chain